ncbi:MAG: glycosyltransferase family 2 protein [Burkholderiales bacterium]|nr:MAG: glycosyltransferase family 2 protein [Burkholderiales bacterium]
MNPSPAPQDPRVGIAAIFRNEFPYIVEWLAHHRVLGIDAFFIADNGSDDGSTELLAALDRLGYLSMLPFPTRDNTPPQMPAYTALMERHGHQVDWMAFIDADEFLMPTGPHSVKQVLMDAAGTPNAGAMAVNWAVFGSGGHVKQPPGLVLENFQRRAEQQLINNHHIKSIVRCQAFASVDGNPHIFRLHEGWHYVHPDGTELQHHAERGRGLSQKICWDRLRLNHYVVKSREEFERRKSPKGSATRMDRSKGQGYFQHHDRNEMADAVNPLLLRAVQAEVDRIMEALARQGGIPVERPPAEVSPTLFQGIRGHVDKLDWSDDSLSIKGWALCGDGEPPSFFELLVGGQPVPDFRLMRFDRPDVQRHYPGASLQSGFHIQARVPAAAALGGPVRVVTGRIEGGPRAELVMPASTAVQEPESNTGHTA